MKDSFQKHFDHWSAWAISADPCQTAPLKCNVCIIRHFEFWCKNYSENIINTAYWSTIGSIYFSIKIVSPVRIFGNLGCFSTLITVPTCKVISVHMSFEHCKGLVPGLYVDILKVFCTAGSQCNSLFLTTADCCSKEKVFPPSLPIFILNSLITI